MGMRIRSFLSLTLLACTLTGHAQTLVVDSQERFDGLRAAIDSAVAASPEEVRVRFEKGTYYYRERQLDFSGFDRPDLRLTLEGNGAVLVAAGKDFVLDASNGRRMPYDGDFSPEDGFVSLTRMETTDLRDSVRQAFTHPIPVNLFKKLYCIRCREQDLSEQDARDAYIIFTQWYVGAVYKVKRIKNGWLFFYADKKYQTRLYEELRYGRCNPRYVLYNQRSDSHPSIIAGMLEDPVDETVHRCEASNFLTLDHAALRSFRMEGFRFLGNREADALLRFESVQADSLVISDCAFEGIKSHAVLIGATEHVRVRNNRFEKCYLRGVHADYRCRDVEVTSNFFRDHGLMVSTSPAVYCQADVFLVADNVFEDFSYCAIGLGTHYIESDKPYTAGIVERNEIYQTERFRRKPMRVLVDSGAIYVWTLNKDLVIRNNYLHDISGPHGNRGILCDDGAMNVTIHGNLVLAVDRNAYQIDLRRNYAVERKKRCTVPRVNIGNKMWGNWVDGRVRFHVRRGDPDSFQKANVVLEPGYDRQEVYRRWRAQIDAS